MTSSSLTSLTSNQSSLAPFRTPKRYVRLPHKICVYVYVLIHACVRLFL
jgi:hypothetical protein